MEIVLTGLGTVQACGAGRPELARALRVGSPPALTEVDRGGGFHLAQSARLAALIGGVDLRAWVAPAESRRMSLPSRLALAAARLALADAGLPYGREALAEAAAAVVMSTAFGPSSCTEGLLRQIFLDSPEAASPFLFTESVANAPASQIAILLGARGPGITLCQREAGPLLALSRAAAELAAGRASLALAGAVEEMTPLLHAVLDRFGALARPAPGGEEAGRPFDRRRDGLVAAEGASLVVLESAASARRRGVRPLARLLGWGSAFDPTATATDWGQGHESLGRSLRRTLARSGVAASDVACIVSGASGSPSGDRLEALTLRAAWEGLPLPPVLAPKAVTGEYGGGFLGAAVLAAAGEPFGPTPGFAQPDPELGLTPYQGEPRPRPATLLATSLAAGGAAAWVLFAAPEAS
jgi:3-oxoacyl-[acyl-carrier-protein] synthase II